MTTRRTLEEFLRLPEEEPALEYMDGVVTQKVAPKGRHSWLQLSLAEYFNGHTRPRKLALAVPELRATSHRLCFRICRRASSHPIRPRGRFCSF